MRDQGSLFGVWSAEAKTFLHPNFQFESSGQVHPSLPALLRPLIHPDDRGFWRVAFVLFGSYEALSDQTLVELFQQDPARAISIVNRMPLDD